jgi:hypothetical protein
MPKFYVKHKDLTLITDEINSENAAARMMLLLEELDTKNLIYVDERGHRTKTAAYKYSIVKTISRHSKKPIWYLKIKK